MRLTFFPESGDWFPPTNVVSPRLPETGESVLIELSGGDHVYGWVTSILEIPDFEESAFEIAVVRAQ